MQNIDALCISLNPDSNITKKVLETIKNLGFKNVKIIKAVDGKNINKEELKEILSFRDFYELENGRYVHEAFSGKESIGCFLSHLKCWEKCYETGKELAIFEDNFDIDGDISHAKETLNKAYLDSVQGKYDILRITPINVNHYQNIKEKISETLYRIKRDHCLAGYIITPRASEYLLKHSKPISCQCDHYINFISYNYNLNHYGLTKTIYKDGLRPTTLKHNHLLKYKDLMNNSNLEIVRLTSK